MKILRFLSVLLLLCFLPVCAFAMDAGLIEHAAEWSDKAEFVPLKIETPFTNSNLKGYLLYYSDLATNRVYLHLGYSTEALSNGDTVYLFFNVSNDTNEYAFSADKNGICEPDENVSKAFKVRTNFSNVQGNGQEIYAEIEFVNKADKKLNNRIDISLNVNNTVFTISENIPLNYGDYAASLTTAKPTTTKHTTTKHTTDTKTTTQKSTEKPTKKPISVGTATEATENGKTTAPKPESTTKFKYTPTTSTAPDEVPTKAPEADSPIASTAATESISSNPTEGRTAYVFGNANENKTEHNEISAGAENQTAGAPDDNAPPENSDIILPEAQSAGSLSPQAKLLAALAIVFAVLGTALIIRSLPKKDKNTENESNNEKDE